MLLDCTLGSLQLFRGFVSRGFEQTLINLTAIEIFEYLLLQLNELSNFSCNFDHIIMSSSLAHGSLSCLRLLLKARSYNYSC